MSGVFNVGLGKLAVVAVLAALACGPVFAQSIASEPKLEEPAPPPVWPDQSRVQKEQGKADLSLCVNDIGQVTAARVNRSTGYPKLDNASLEWAKTLKFKPAMRSGMPTPVCGHRMSYEWSLRHG